MSSKVEITIMTVGDDGLESIEMLTEREVAQVRAALLAVAQSAVQNGRPLTAGELLVLETRFAGETPDPELAAHLQTMRDASILAAYGPAKARSDA